MSNDPKDTVVDLSKLMRGQSSANKSTLFPPTNETSTMVTSCNEGVNLIGNEIFTYNGNTQKRKPD